MVNFLKIGVWNANGLVQKNQELKMFLTLHDIDIMFIFETYFTKKATSRYLNILFITPNIQMKPHLEVL
jgi:DNA helicase TIP49 (TBP-interacting protein)